MSRQRRLQLWGFLTIGLLSLTAGLLFERDAPPLDQLCSARTAQELETADGRQWLLHQHALDLRGDGHGDTKSSSRLLEVGEGQALGYLHRTTSFTHSRQGQRLLLHVQRSDKSETDTLQSQQLASLGLFLFTEGVDLTFNMRHLGKDKMLIGNGLGVALLCEQNLQRH